MIISGIYKIQSIRNPERIYIGSAIDILKRWRQHKGNLRRNKHHSVKLQRHFNKYGESDLLFSLIVRCTQEELIEKEQFFIDSHKPWFNICPKAGNTLGYKHTKETMAILIGHIVTEETKRKISKRHIGQPSHNKGKHLSEDVRLKISQNNKGKHSASRRHWKCSIEARKNMSIARIKSGIIPPNALGVKRSEETRRKQSESAKGRPSYWKGSPGRKLSEEAKIKISQSVIAYYKKRIA